MLYGFADSLQAGSGRNCSSVMILCIQYKTPDDGQKTCPKHVEFYSKNKFEKFVHLVGFIIRIYHDARSSECQKGNCVLVCRVFAPLHGEQQDLMCRKVKVQEAANQRV